MSGTRLGFSKVLPLGTLLALILPLLLVFTAPVSAATLCVTPGGGGGCYASIQAAVNATASGDTIEVRTGTYSESVDLEQAGGDISVVAVDGPGTVTVDGSANPAFHMLVSPSDHVTVGHVTIDGFVLDSNSGGIFLSWMGGDVDIRNVTASSTGHSGIHLIRIGKVSISDCAVNNNTNSGIHIGFAEDVTITNCTANDNDRGGIGTFGMGDVTITNCTTNGNGGPGLFARGAGDVTITNCTANDNDRGGIGAFGRGDVTITNCTANSNANSQGVVVGSSGNVTISGCMAQGNYDGVLLVSGMSSVGVHGSIMCNNSHQGLEFLGSGTVDATGNWWGCPDGPGKPGCDTVDPGTGTVNFDPWIDTVTASAPASAMAGDPTMVSFQFSDSSQSVFLGQGPGDLHGDPTFIVTTDNGTISEGGFVNAPDGVMEVTLVPDHSGTATVWADGPCGLDSATGLDDWEFVPEPGSILLLGSGLVGLAGYATLRWRTRE